MECKLCGKPATGACGRCGSFYCERHGGEDPYHRAFCCSCYDKVRPHAAAMGLIAIIFGLVLLGLGVLFLIMDKAQAIGLIFLLLCPFAFAAGVWQFGNSRKDFPTVPR